MNIFVGNIAYKTTEESLQELFSTHGQVASVKLITDRETGRPRGFGFVEMPNDEEARAAIQAIDGKEHDGRTLSVKEAHSKEGRGPGGGGPRGGGKPPL
jgi:RNA recognition motif-containing protein